MSKIKKIILIIVSFFFFIIALCVIVDILDYKDKDNENTSKVDKTEMSKKAEMLRKNTLTFEGLFHTMCFNLDYVQNLEGPVKYVDRNGNTNNVFTINAVFQESMKVTNLDIFEWQNLKAFEVAAEKIKYGEIETIDYPFRMKGDDEEDYKELNFKNIFSFGAMSDFYNGKSHLYFASFNPYTFTTFTFTNAAYAELAISILKGYGNNEINKGTGRPLTNKDDDF